MRAAPGGDAGTERGIPVRRSESQARPQRELDSLVDIVSNIVGILVILAAFMALFGLINPATVTEPQRAPNRPQPPKRLLIPWSHATHKNSVMFSLEGNRLLHLDLRAFYRRLGERRQQGRPRPETVEQPGLDIRFFPVTSQVYCLEFKPKPRAGETWLQALGGGSDWKRTLGLYPPEKFYYFFWVAGDSFELFREVRKTLWENNYEVGWKPLAKKAAMETCTGFSGSTGFQPQ